MPALPLANAYTAVLAVSVPMLAWIAFYLLNEWFFAAGRWADGINWIFLPAAIRLLAVLAFGPLGALGLFIGSLFTMAVVENAFLDRALAVSVASSIAPLLAVGVVLRQLRLPASLCGLGTAQLAALAVASAATSVALHNLYYWLSDHRADPLSGLLPMFVGDIVGTVLVLYTLRSGLKFHSRLRSLRRR